MKVADVLFSETIKQKYVSLCLKKQNAPNEVWKCFSLWIKCIFLSLLLANMCSCFNQKVFYMSFSFFIFI